MPITTSEYVADYLNIDVEDSKPLLTRLCAAVATRIEGYCDREFDRERHTEYHDMSISTGIVWVNNPPIDTLWSLTDNAQHGARVINSTSDVQIYNSHNGGMIRLWNTEGVFVTGIQSVKIIYTGGYARNEMPADLELAAAQMVAVLWEGAEPLARESQNIDGEQIKWRADSIPPQAKPILNKYRRVQSV